MSAASFPTGTVTFMFTDIEGSTRLWEAEHEAMRGALAAHDAILRAAIEARSGTVFKTVGDAFCAVFAQPEDALAAAVSALQALAMHAWPAAIGTLRVRMGIHTGTAVETPGDYYGPTVNRVARLMSLGYGEQILVSSATASLLRAALPGDVSLRDLGSHRLKDLSKPETIYQVVVPGLRSDFPTLASLDARPNNLPFQISTFVGRDREQRDVREALSLGRLTTIVGPGGIGKTRLALQVAGDAIGDLKDGAWFVQLSHVHGEALIAQAVADVLSVREESTMPIVETLTRSLAERQMLLVLDGAEHLRSEVAAFVKLLLSRCAYLKVLVTSREPLHLAGERVVRIAALEDAARLFIERAREIAPQQPYLDQLPLVEAICRRVDGIPLAIELAAARLTTMPLPELYERLSKRLALLVSRDSTVEERHRTLRGTIAWSYDLLVAPDAALLRALAVFNGSFSTPAVAAVAHLSEDECLERLDDLAGKSLVTAQPVATSARYVLYDTVREYLAERLSPEELSECCERHFGHYGRLAQTLTTPAHGGELAAWLDSVALEISNLRGALEWGLSERPSEAATAFRNVSRYFKIRGYLTEGRAWFRRFLAVPVLDDGTRAGLLRRAATFATEQDDYDEAHALTMESRTLYERTGDAGGVAEALHNLAVIEQRRGRLDEAAAFYADAIGRFRESGNAYGEAVASMNAALVLLDREELDRAEECLDAAESAAARLGNLDLDGALCAARAALAMRRSDFDTASRLYQQALRMKETVGSRSGVADLHSSLAVLYVRQGRLAEAKDAAQSTLRLALELESTATLIYAFEAFCEIGAREANYAAAAHCLGLAKELRRTHSFWHPTPRMDAIEAELREQLGTEFDATIAGCAALDWRTAAQRLVEGAYFSQTPT